MEDFDVEVDVGGVIELEGVFETFGGDVVADVWVLVGGPGDFGERGKERGGYAAGCFSLGVFIESEDGGVVWGRYRVVEFLVGEVFGFYTGGEFSDEIGDGV